jgi:hypothetical protein
VVTPSDRRRTDLSRRRYRVAAFGLVPTVGSVWSLRWVRSGPYGGFGLVPTVRSLAGGGPGRDDTEAAHGRDETEGAHGRDETEVDVAERHRRRSVRRPPPRAGWSYRVVTPSDRRRTDLSRRRCRVAAFGLVPTVGSVWSLRFVRWQGAAPVGTRPRGRTVGTRPRGRTVGTRPRSMSRSDIGGGPSAAPLAQGLRIGW